MNLELENGARFFITLTLGTSAKEYFKTLASSEWMDLMECEEGERGIVCGKRKERPST